MVTQGLVSFTLKWITMVTYTQLLIRCYNVMHTSIIASLFSWAWAELLQVIKYQSTSDSDCAWSTQLCAWTHDWYWYWKHSTFIVHVELFIWFVSFGPIKWYSWSRRPLLSFILIPQDDHLLIIILTTGAIGLLSRMIPCTSVMFRETPPTYNFSWHNAPRRQFIVNLDADVEITVSTGETQIIKQGDVFFVEDTNGT